MSTDSHNFWDTYYRKHANPSTTGTTLYKLIITLVMFIAELIHNEYEKILLDAIHAST